MTMAIKLVVIEQATIDFTAFSTAALIDIARRRSIPPLDRNMIIDRLRVQLLRAQGAELNAYLRDLHETTKRFDIKNGVRWAGGA